MRYFIFVLMLLISTNAQAQLDTLEITDGIYPQWFNKINLGIKAITDAGKWVQYDHANYWSIAPKDLSDTITVKITSDGGVEAERIVTGSTVFGAADMSGQTDTLNVAWSVDAGDGYRVSYRDGIFPWSTKLSINPFFGSNLYTNLTVKGPAGMFVSDSLLHVEGGTHIEGGLHAEGDVTVAGTLKTGGRIYTAVDSITFAGEAGDIIDASKGNIFVGTLTQNDTISIINMADGQTISVRITNAGTYTLSWEGVSWPEDTPPTLTAVANKRDWFTFIKVGGIIDGTKPIQNYP